MIGLADAGSRDAAAVGGKARALGAALARGLAVPDGVVLEPGETVDARAIVSELGPAPYAVRSSAPFEDGAGRSWAGQLASVVPVGQDGLEDAVEQVRESGRGAPAIAYGGTGDGAIPVLVQRVVDARAAGIAFSIDPSDGDEYHCVVEAVPGLAVALTDGAVAPARYRVPVEGPVPEPHAPLDRAALGGVLALVLDVADWLGVPCDVEWAWDGECTWLVQARPVTAATWSPRPGQWTSANLREAMPGTVTPLSFSLIVGHEMAPAIDAVMHWSRLAAPEESVCETALLYGRPYWRVDLMKERLLRLPGFSERDWDESVGLTPAYEGPGRRAALTPRSLARALPVIRGAIGIYRSVGPRAARFLADLDRTGAGLLGRDDPSADDLPEALDLHHEVNHYAFAISVVAEQAQDTFRQLAKLATRSLEPPLDDRLLLAGIGPVATAAPTRAIEEAARRHAGDAEAIEAAGELDELPPAAALDLAEVIREYGWMASALDELAEPRWDEDPALPLALFKATVAAQRVAARAEPEHPGPGAAARGPAAVAGEEARARSAAGALWPALAVWLRLARRYARLREELRAASGRTNRVVRRALLAQGRRWADAGILAGPGDVFWLEFDEVRALLARGAEPAGLRDTIEARRRHSRRFRNWEPPHVLDARLPEPPPAAETNGALTGIACSSGIARGPVAVLSAMEQVASLEPGSILVMRRGHPGWTPAFLVASGLVIEESGLLSHTSIVARERGLPAVINVPDATSRLRDGQRVEVDGRRGTVTVLEDGAP